MKKIAFIFRDGYDAKYICSQLESYGNEYSFYYIIESGKDAKRKKIKRMIKKSNILVFFVDALFLLIYNYDMMKRMKRVLGKQYYPAQIKYYTIADVNEKGCIDLCNNLQPDVVLIYGTGILKSTTIKLICADIYNIHSSILPYYRNVHSDFWAYVNSDFSKIGITIFKMDSGIDTGDIFFQKKALMPDNATLDEYKVKNLQNIPPMILNFLSALFSGQLQFVKQDNELSSIATTPTAVEILHFWMKGL